MFDVFGCWTPDMNDQCDVKQKYLYVRIPPEMATTILWNFSLAHTHSTIIICDMASTHGRYKKRKKNVACAFFGHVVVVVVVVDVCYLLLNTIPHTRFYISIYNIVWVDHCHHIEIQRIPDIFFSLSHSLYISQPYLWSSWQWMRINGKPAFYFHIGERYINEASTFNIYYIIIVIDVNIHINLNYYQYHYLLYKRPDKYHMLEFRFNRHTLWISLCELKKHVAL